MTRISMAVTAVALSVCLLNGPMLFAQDSKEACTKCPATAKSCATCKTCPSDMSCPACQGDEKKEASNTSQNCQSCTESGKSVFCTSNYGLIGVDFTVDTDVDSDGSDKQAGSEAKNEIAIQLTCDCDVPFLSNIPYINTLFKNRAGAVVPAKIVTSTCSQKSECCSQGAHCCNKSTELCSTSKECCNKSSECSKSTECCSKSTECCSKSTECCSKSTECCSAACKSDCGLVCAASAPSKASSSMHSECCSTCGNKGRTETIQLASFSQADDSISLPRSEVIEEMVELRVENERLRAELDAMEHRIEMIHEMCELREKNAALVARLEVLERQSKHATVRFQPNPTPHYANPPRIGVAIPATPGNRQIVPPSANYYPATVPVASPQPLQTPATCQPPTPKVLPTPNERPETHLSQAHIKYLQQIEKMKKEIREARKSK